MTSEHTTGVLTQLSEALAAAVERAGRSTVTVHARRRIPASGTVWQPGVILTCDHVLERDEDITVTTSDGRELPAPEAPEGPQQVDQVVQGEPNKDDPVRGLDFEGDVEPQVPPPARRQA